MGKRKKKLVSLAGAKKHKATVDNPDWRPDRDGERAFPRKIEAEINVRESAVETLYARKFLGSAQKLAADKFRALWETAGAKTGSLDYSHDRVDGSKGDPLITRLQAAEELKRCRILLGARGYETVQAICGEGRALADLSPHKREKTTMADNLRADLDDLATMWHLQTRQRPTPSPTRIVSEAKQNA